MRKSCPKIRSVFEILGNINPHISIRKTQLLRIDMPILPLSEGVVKGLESAFICQLAKLDVYFNVKNNLGV